VNAEELKGGHIVTDCSSPSEAERTFVALHLALPMPKIGQFCEGMGKIVHVWCNGVQCLVMVN
jgi:hypothetical protein